MKHFLALCTLIFVGLISQPAEAKVLFGTKATVHRIADVSLKGPKGEDLYLARLSTMRFFLLGVYLEDNGYVLGIKGTHDTYYDLPSKPVLLAAQKTGLLPDPLPEYSFSLWEYLLGYSMWLFIAFLFVSSVISKRKKRRKTVGS